MIEKLVVHQTGDKQPRTQVSTPNKESTEVISQIKDSIWQLADNQRKMTEQVWYVVFILTSSAGWLSEIQPGLSRQERFSRSFKTGLCVFREEYIYFSKFT